MYHNDNKKTILQPECKVSHQAIYLDCIQLYFITYRMFVIVTDNLLNLVKFSSKLRIDRIFYKPLQSDFTRLLFQLLLMQNRPSAYNQVFDGSYLCSKNKAQLVLFCNDCTLIDCLGHKKVNLFFIKKKLLYAEGQVYFKYDHYMWIEIQPTIQFFRSKISENDCI